MCCFMLMFHVNELNHVGIVASKSVTTFVSAFQYLPFQENYENKSKNF